MAKRSARSFLQLHVSERFPDPLNPPPVRWTLRAGARVEDGVSPVEEVPGADEVLLVLPVARVAFVRAALPRGPAAKLGRLAPFAIEDAIASAPEDVHCVVLDGADEVEAERLVAVLDRQWLADVCSELAANGLAPDRAIVESALVPAEDDAWTVVWTGSGGFAVLAGGEAVALDASPDGRPPLALKLAADERRRGSGALRGVQVVVAGTAEPPDIGRWSESLHVPVVLAGKWLPEEIDAQEIEFPDLLPDAGSGSWHDHEWARRLKPAAIFAAAILLVHGALTIGDWARLAYEARSLRTSMETAFRGAFPEAKVVVDPALQMRRNVADLRRAAGEPDAADMIPLLARIAPALAAAGARPQSLRYEHGELQLELAVASGETRERLASRLQVPGVRVRVERVTAGGAEPLATVRVGVEGA